MKKTLLLFVFILAYYVVYPQVVLQDSSGKVLTATDYLQKSKKQKTGGWILFSISAVSGISGFALLLDETGNAISDTGNDLGTIVGASNQPNTYKDGRATTGAVLMAVGAASLISSIVLFSSSGKNKRKAVTVSYKSTQIPFLSAKGTIASNSIPSVVLRIRL